MTDEPKVRSAADARSEAPPQPRSRRWPRVPARLTRYTRLVIIVAVALAAAALVSVVTIDLGPVVRAQAERTASARIQRPVHIGRLGTYLLPGRFLVEDLVIEGLSQDDEPFLRTERIVVTTSWLALLRGEILIDGAEMASWRMVVESFPNGRHSFPRFTGPSSDEVKPETEEAADSADPDDSGRYIVTTVRRLLAPDGEFVFRDHGVPWSVVARNINLTIAKGEGYGGEVSFTNGTLQIGSFKPMTVEMDATYELDGAFVHLTQIGLMTDGFASTLTGEVDLLNWPEQTYHIVESDIELPPMKEIFFADDNFTTTGRASFTGAWHLFDGGRELTGTFASSDATLNGLGFPALEGSLVWTRDRFEVLDARSRFYGGTLDFDYEMQPLGQKTPGWATFDTIYQDVDLVALLDGFQIEGVRPQGLATGRNLLRWPIGDFAERTGEGQLSIAPVPDVSLMMSTASSGGPARPGSYAVVPYSRDGEPWRFPVGGTVAYMVAPESIEIEPSRLATPYTQVEFFGRTAYGGDSHIPFQVRSADWQESDRLMAAFLTAFGAATGEFQVSGHGRFDGAMHGTFASPRIEARFDGADINAWNVDWGSGRGAITVANGYLDVAEGRFAREASTLAVDGRFALGARSDGGEQIGARFELAAFPAERIRQAFGLEGYHIDGPLSGEIRLHGEYGRPYGDGELTLTEPVAYGEPFRSATARLRFEGNGVRVEGLDVRKGTGTVTGAAFIRWDGTYSFNADGRDIMVASIDATRVQQAPLGGVLQFTAEGAGAFADPRYEVRGTVSALTVSGETVGEVTGRVDVRDGVMGFEAEAASPRLAVSGSGRVEVMDTDAELLFRFTNTTIDPYVRAFAPSLSDRLSADVSGTLQILGKLRDVEQLQVVSTVEQLDLDLLDFRLRNDGPVRFVLKENIVAVKQMQLVGDDTALTVTGQIGLGDEQVALRATGDAGLRLLESFVPDIRSSGNMRLVAEVGGTLRQPLITGEAAIDNGRIRHLAFPHGLEEIDGQIVFEPDSIGFEGLTGELGNGVVRFGGRVGLEGYSISELNVTASATEIRLRFPEGVRSLVDAELALVGGVDDPVLSGNVDVRDAVLLELFQSGPGLLEFSADESLVAPGPTASAFPLRFDIRINAPSSLRISDNTARVVSSAELTLGGTYDQPLMFGNAEIERGEVFFEGNRYRVTRGSIGFANPTSIEPFFDIEAETDVRAPGQTYRVTLGVVGTMERLDFELASDPPLPEFEIMSLLLGNIRDPQAAELRTLRAQDESRQELFQAGAARLLTSPLSSGVGRVVEESFGVDTFQITPSLVDPSAQQSAQLIPTARLLIGKRISDRAHVTLSRTLTGANQDIIVVLEYDQSDQLSWILSQNEDRTYALDFRMRHAF